MADHDVSLHDGHDVDETPFDAAHDPTRPHSIDLSVALEHQLDSESLPPTPAHALTSGTTSSREKERPQSLDPHILASIIVQLRASLEEVSKERDGLATVVAGAHKREADLRDALELMTEKWTVSQQELDEARRKNRDDEDAINMLRTKVEESRRGLMRLQSENRRQSVNSNMTLDMSRASAFASGAPSSSKRMSFTPLTGSGVPRQQLGHRRISSVSDSGYSLPDMSQSASPPQASNAVLPPVPSPGEGPTQVLTIPSPGGAPSTANAPPSSMGRFFGRNSPPGLRPPAPTFVSDPGLAAEIVSLRRELESARAELGEAVEAREASEDCVRSLRAFIAEQNFAPPINTSAPSSGGVKLPPLPAETTGEEPDTKARTVSGGWGFGKLFTSPQPPAAAAPNVAVSPPTSEPLTKKLGGFFGAARRSSVSSASSSLAPSTHASAPAAATTVHVQEPMFNGTGSDVSSIAEDAAEPLSPISVGAGAGQGVLVRENRGSNGSDLAPGHDAHVEGKPHAEGDQSEVGVAS